MSFYTSFDLIGENLFLRYVADDGTKQMQKIPVKPRLFTPSTTPTEYKSLYGDYIAPKDFESVREAKGFIDQYRNTNYRIWGMNRFEYPLINDLFATLDYDTRKINIMFWDIETESEEGFPDIATANEAINAMTMIVNDRTICLTTIHNTIKHEELEGAELYVFSNEEDMLRNFLQFMRDLDVDVITGWNVAYFDTVYTYNRIKRLFGEKMCMLMSPFNIVKSRTFTSTFGREQQEIEIVGVTVLDYLELYKKFTYKMQERYTLDHIANVELGEEKIQFDGSFKEFYTNNPNKFLLYNIHDSRLVVRMNDKLKLLELAFTIAYAAKVKYSDVFMNTRVWDVIICNFLEAQGRYLPAWKNPDTGAAVEGAYVKDSLKGRYNWLAGLDLTSLYPCLIMQYNISPETMLDPGEFIPLRDTDVINETDSFKRAMAKAKELDATLCANGAMFSRKEYGILPQLVEIYFKQRKAAKNEKLDWERRAELVKAEIQRRKVCR